MLAGAPLGVRPAADAEEDAVDGASLGLAGGVREGHGAELSTARVQLGQLRLDVDVDQRMRLDPLDQVGGHAPAEAVAAHEHRHARRLVREVEDGLAGRVAGPDHDDVLASALRRLAAPGAVVDPVADEIVDALEVEPCPIHAWSREDDGRRHLGVVLEDQPDRLLMPVHPAAADASHEQKFGAESLGLAARQPSELRAADPVGEAEEVLDHRRVRGLTARYVGVAYERREPV